MSHNEASEHQTSSAASTLTTREAATLVEANEQLILASLRAASAEEALRDADRRKDEFLAMLGHELRNPLAAIRNVAEIVKVQDPSHRFDRMHDILVRQVGHLTRLVDDLLDISLIARGVMTLQTERVNVGALLNRVVQDSTPMTAGRKQSLSLRCPESPVWVQGDAIRLAQVVDNLITNASKYSDDGGHILIVLDVDADDAVLEVRDDGWGIAPAMQSRIFDLFVQDARAINRSRGGLGIGLALVQHLVNKHGGSINVSSDGEGTGSTFVVRLPIDLSVGVSQAYPHAQPISTGRVLVVDDDVEAGETLATLLGLYGYAAHSAVDLPSAMHAAQTYRPQAVLMDIAMPGADGYAVADALRTLPEMAGAFYAALSGFGQSEHIDRSHDSGFIEHIVKPADPEVIDALLKRLIGAHT